MAPGAAFRSNYTRIPDDLETGNLVGWDTRKPDLPASQGPKIGTLPTRFVTIRLGV
jgi:hypothetical protein